MVNIELHNMDCMEGMGAYPDNYFDLAIVDPPYGLGCMTHGLGTKVKHKRTTWNNAPPNKEYFIELRRISNHQIIWGCNYFFPNIPEVGRIIHDKQMTAKNGCPIKLSECDIASQTFHKRIDKFTYQWSGNVQNGKINWDNTGPDARIHPTQKPIALYKWLLKNYAKEGNKILDTHLGSGSIAAACWDMGFDLIGFDTDKEYFEAASKRLENHKKQLQIAW